MGWFTRCANYSFTWTDNTEDPKTWEIVFNYAPGYPATYWEPEVYDEVEFISITDEDDNEMSDELFMELENAMYDAAINYVNDMG